MAELHAYSVSFAAMSNDAPGLGQVLKYSARPRPGAIALLLADQDARNNSDQEALIKELAGSAFRPRKHAGQELAEPLQDHACN